MNDRQHDSPSEVPPMPPALRDWTGKQPPERRQRLERSWALAGLAEEVLPTGPEATGATWEGVADALRNDPGRESAPAARRAAKRRATSRAPVGSRSGAARVKRRLAAAFVALALLAGAGLWLWLRPVTVAVPAGATHVALLPDGSRAKLNSGSALTYRRGLPFLGWDRDVRLEGEAFFEVEKGEKSFTVTTFNARAEVLGTRFNVRARPEASAPPAARATTVTLATGALRFWGKGGDRQSVTLAPGQESRVTGSGGVPTPPAPADLGVALAWRTGGLAFPNSQVGPILNEVERRFAVEIQAPPALRRDSLSLYLPDASGPAAVLRDLCAVQGCRYHRTDSGGFVVE